MKYQTAPLAAVVAEVMVTSGEAVRKGQELMILEAMKMENAICAEEDSIVTTIIVKVGDTIVKGQRLLQYKISTSNTIEPRVDDIQNLEGDPLLELTKRLEYLKDSNRPAAVEKRKSKGQNMARENLHKLVDEGSFKEYGSLVIAAQRTRRSTADLIKNTPADGLIMGTATINQDGIATGTGDCIVMIYDYTVLAGTQGTMNHHKMDRMLHIAQKNKLPVILFAEGGGGRPGDVDQQTIAGLHISTFVEFGRLSGMVPVIAVVSGYCFAGNAALAGMADVIIATEDSSLGMGGPAMIEGGGLGSYHPKEVGPPAIHIENGVIDILVKDEDEAIVVAKKYLSYFQGDTKEYTVADQSALREAIPHNRKRAYDIRSIVRLLSDTDSTLELRADYGKGLLTYLVRIEGKAFGLIANNPTYEAGAINSENAIKANAFIKLCNQHQLPIISLVDTPGIMVGPQAEASGTVRHASQLFITGAQLRVPFYAFVLRRAYGLGAMAMLGGSTRVPDFVVAWPTGEFGAMGLEGAVKLGFRKELKAIEDLEERENEYHRMVELAYERGKAVSMASMFEIDNVIDPIDTRSWILLAHRQHQ